MREEHISQKTIKDWRMETEEALAKANFPNPSLEAKWLLANALEKENSFITLHPDYAPSSTEQMQILEWIKRRLNDEPLSRIKGIREFWSLPFRINEHTLDPRPETELVVEEVLKFTKDNQNKPFRILDLGTGSGCILIALLHELKNATGLGVDISEEALKMAQENATQNRVEKRISFLQNNWTQGLTETFDIIVSNPPYIPLSEKEALEDAVRKYDPFLALFGGKDGLACYRILSQEIRPLMSDKSIAVFEFGIGQRKDIEQLFHEQGFQTVFVAKDLAGIERVVGFKVQATALLRPDLSDCNVKGK